MKPITCLLLVLTVACGTTTPPVVQPNASFISEASQQINTIRATARNCGNTSYPAAPAITWNNKLYNAAYAHSQDMQTNNFFEHTNPNGGLVFSARISRAGYLWAAAGENIAAGQPDIPTVMQDLVNSPGHCANLMSSSFTEFALAEVPGKNGNAYAHYWTLDFASPK